PLMAGRSASGLLSRLHRVPVCPGQRTRLLAESLAEYSLTGARPACRWSGVASGRVCSRVGSVGYFSDLLDWDTGIEPDNNIGRGADHPTDSRRARGAALDRRQANGPLVLGGGHWSGTFVALGALGDGDRRVGCHRRTRGAGRTVRD